MNDTLHGRIKQLLGGLDRLLPPVELEAAFALLASEHQELQSQVLGTSGKGHPIRLYRWGHGPVPVLWYGYPDPGESVGGTGIYALVRGLLQGLDWLTALPLSWYFIPCLNFDDQPDAGRSLGKVMKTPAEEVDWCLHRPRPETTALAELLQSVKPALTFPLHDEYHCHEALPVYFPVQPALPALLCEQLRTYTAAYGFDLDSGHTHRTMGAGFFEMAEIGAEFSRSTFCLAAEFGQVFIVEPCWQPKQAPLKPAAFQLACCLEVLYHTLAKGHA